MTLPESSPNQFRKKMSLDETNSFLEDIGEVPLL